MNRRRVRRRTRHRADTPLLHRIASVLLRYPDPRTLALLDDVTAAIGGLDSPADRARLTAFTDHLRGLTPTEAAQAHVAAFDHTRRRCPYLTYSRHGDTRARGMALLALKHTYRQAGHEPPESELPDYLPLILEFAALAPEEGHRVLLQCRSGLELLRQALHEHGAPHAPLLDALCERLPGLGREQRETLRRLSAEGPPTEDVGLEPFAPPEFLTHTAVTIGDGR